MGCSGSARRSYVLGVSFDTGAAGRRATNPVTSRVPSFELKIGVSLPLPSDEIS
jgi:hypothetical protein